MDLSLPSFETAGEVTLPPHEIRVLLAPADGIAGVAAGPALLRPADGAFNGALAAAMRRWGQE